MSSNNHFISSSSRKKYDSCLVWLCNSGNEHLIPSHLKTAIPHSTLSTWRNTDYSSYFGHEVRTVQQQALEYYSLFEQYASLKKTVFVLARVWGTVSSILLPVLQKKKEYEAVLVEVVQQLFSVFSHRFAFRLVGISATSFSERLSRVKVRCGISPLQLCFKRHPLQLAVREVQKIRELLPILP